MITSIRVALLVVLFSLSAVGDAHAKECMHWVSVWVQRHEGYTEQVADAQVGEVESFTTTLFTGDSLFVYVQRNSYCGSGGTHLLVLEHDGPGLAETSDPLFLDQSTYDQPVYFNGVGSFLFRGNTALTGKVQAVIENVGSVVSVQDPPWSMPVVQVSNGELWLTSAEACDVILRTLTGSVCSQQAFVGSSISQSMTLPPMAAGIYLVTVQGRETSRSARIFLH